MQGRANLDIQQLVLVGNIGWTLTLELENNDSSIMSGSEEIQLRVSSKAPVTVSITTERLLGVGKKKTKSRQTWMPRPRLDMSHTRIDLSSDALQIRHTNETVGVPENEILPWVEDSTGHVVVVTTACIHLPGLGICHE